MTSLKTSIKTITYLSDIGCLEIQGASLAREDTIPKELATEDTVVKTTKKLLTGKTESFLAIVLSLSFFKIINFIYPSP